MALKATEEQVLYAKILNIGMLIGLIGLVVAFFILSKRIRETQITFEKLKSDLILYFNE